MENSVLGLDKAMIPMMSSNTMATDLEGAGRPKSEDGKKSASGEKTDANNSNDPDNRNFSVNLDEIIV